ncbi:EAL domain-containing protein [Chitinimonas sp. BJB300]|uniref:EAL domain-containing protein n=1 Tax=Chitinimonas sp. BJB300 TaxID=1559339 RepID=UPI000C0EE259|nr:EAL domain-containing protein [Chitinimonas sp. BJB300]PHV09777.1 sensor domain-containing diguanylate cyclase [Chitinimonas sp. BJB300]TSJ91095.1 EAL domain-containing protein [Chitinimonas sp. BJB300]
MHVPFFRTLRARLVLAILVVQFVVLAVLLANVNRVWSDMVLRATEVRVEELARLLNAALAPPMASLDYTPAAELLDGMRTPDGIDYLVLFDHQGKVVAARGWDVGTALPPPDQLEALHYRNTIPPVVHASIDIKMAGKQYGLLRFGLSTELLSESANRVLIQSATVVVIGAVLSALVLALLGFWLTRRLYQLMEAAEHQATDGAPQLIKVDGDDEVSALATRFNQMSMGMQERLDALKKNEEKFLAIADYTYGVELWLNPDGELVWVNASVTRLTGYSVKECMEMRYFPLPLATLEERNRVSDAIKEGLTGTAGQDFEFRAMKRDGKVFWAAMSWQSIYDSGDNYLGVRASVRDNSQLKEDRLAMKRAMYELQQSQGLNQTYLARAESERSRLTALLSAMRFGVLFVDTHNLIVFHNPAFKALWLIDESTAITSKPIGQVLQSALNRPENYDFASLLEASESMNASTDDYPGDLNMNDGRIVTQQCFTVRDEQNHVTGRLWVYEDVTQEHFLTERMVFLAERDALTGLYNRHAFQEQLKRMLAEAERNQENVAVLYFDLDEFKYVNDTFGHGVGDDLLKRVAEEISGQVRRNEFFARQGGDEFAILVPNCTEGDVTNLATRIVATVAGIQFTVDGQPLRLSSSLGVAMFPMHAESAEDLVAHADTAMYQAKSAGKATWRMYQAERDASREMVNRLTWNERIQHALENDGFVLYFQGIYEAATRDVAHLEALVRMKDSNNPGQIITPGHFIPHAEKSGKILDIDRWVIGEAVRLLARYPAMPSVAVNISGRSFDETSLPDYIKTMLAEHHVEAARLMVELTETAAVSDMRDAQRFIEALRNTGCTVCLDDFGAGFSSFAYLKHLKAHVLKIDGLFIRDLPRDHDSQVFVKGMAAIARDMGKKTVAEFVENEETLQMLVEFGVDMVQGYYLDKPTPDHPAIHTFGTHETFSSDAT